MTHAKEWKTNYSLKKQPKLTVGKKGNSKKELDAAGLTLDESNKQIYIADCWNSRIQVISVEGEFLKRFGLGILKAPWGIAVTEVSVLITDIHINALFQFSKKDFKFVKMVGTKGEEVRQLNDPRGVCTDYYRDIYVADCGNHRVSIFSEDLKFVKILGTSRLKYPQDVKVIPNSIVVLDRSEYCVHFFSRDGGMIKSIITQGRSGVIYHPLFFCLDPAGNILITDWVDSDAKIFSPVGEVLHMLRKDGQGKWEFVSPCGICVSEIGTIHVTSQNNNFCLQSF